MREIDEYKRKHETRIDIPYSNELKAVLNILENIIEGKRFGNADTKQQMYLLDCQGKIGDMKAGYFTPENIKFLKDSIDSLSIMLDKAKDQLNRYNFLDKGENDES